MHFIDTHNIAGDYIQLGLIPTLRFEKEMLFLLARDGILYHVLKTPAVPFIAGGVPYLLDEPGFRLRQLEFPIAALPWVINTIEKGFWNENLIFKDLFRLQTKTLENPEKLRLSFITNCGAKNMKGVTIENHSRKGKYLAWQEMGFGLNTLVDAGLMLIWKNILSRYQIGELVKNETSN